ncbi:MAG: DNA polymerase III subunit gamma/tau [Betaproteobacteria bacterium]|nr:DNA polymerase III subunit gamma/tau [Betaproteobacteria bacterium]
MTQVLARKWRPRNFAELVGQEHVVRALSNALQQQRLHHAYLFTGTRGVGKTTLARILAKALNCETGITDVPCGKCGACMEIDAGRFVDLIELDAASNTQVDNMRELLENALYAPTSGRFKVYIIDEVHMLSRNAFNAMLKTLEEPPSHVQFILATTDPQKIPVTVLSRCLQFSLKQIPPAQIRGRLSEVLAAENVPADEQSIALVARAAEGSLRDALSLLDQAIAHGGGKLEEASTRAMLGAVDQTYLFAILRALGAQDGAALVAEAERMAERSLSFESALQDFASLLHRVALAQVVPQSLPEGDPDAAEIRELTQVLSAEELQLYYQIAAQGRAEIGLAPDEHAGFMMTLLRMLAFAPAAGAAVAAGVPAVKPAAAKTLGATATAAAVQTGAPASPTAWTELVGQLGLSAMAHQLALRCEMTKQTADTLELRISQADERMFDKPYRDKLTAALRQVLGKQLRVVFVAGEVAGESPKAITDRKLEQRQAAAVAEIREDPFVRELIEDFDGSVEDASIKPK